MTKVSKQTLLKLNQPDREPLEKKACRVDQRRLADDPRVLFRGGVHYVPKQNMNSGLIDHITVDLAHLYIEEPGVML